MEFDSVQIGASDMDAATAAYRVLLGVEPVRLPNGARRFPLRRGAVEIVSGMDGLRSLGLVADPEEETEWPEPVTDFHGFDVRVRGGRPEEAPWLPGGDTAIESIDHVVVRSPDLDRAARLWRDRLGVRLALDRTFPERGLRMLFFRSAGVTLEFVSAAEAASDAAGRMCSGGSPNGFETWRRCASASLEAASMSAKSAPATSRAAVSPPCAAVPPASRRCSSKNAPKADPPLALRSMGPRLPLGSCNPLQ